MKCDEHRPTCFSCHSAGLACSGYAKAIHFEHGDTSDPGLAGARFRRTIFTEDERQAMSRSLTDLVPPSLAHRQLVELDDECEQVPVTQDLQISRGPFGAFRLIRFLPSSPRPFDHYIAVPTIPHPTRSDDSSTCDPSSAGLFSDEIDPIDALLSESVMVVSDCFPPNTLPQLMDLPFLEESQTAYPLDINSNLAQKNWPFRNASSPQLQAQWATLDIAPRQDSFPSPRSALASPHPAVPPNISDLLQHYSTHILRFLTPFRHTKTPWHIMFIPLAKQCVAALTLGERPDHADLCAFYSILALSAFSLAGISQSPILIQEGQTYDQRARQHCRLMLDTAYDIPKTAKYKSTLIALLSIIQVSLCLTGYEAADYYFLETEKFIRFRGLNRTKSRKVRLLHHCYAYSRIFHESIYIGGQPSGHRRQILRAIESSELVAYSSDRPSFRLSKWTDLSKEMAKVKSKEVGENDLHIELPGTWPPTLYPEIFGLSEPWLFLLSLIVRLGKEKDAATARPDQAQTPIPLSEFLARAKTIETFIQYLHRQREAEHRSAAHGHEHRHADICTLHCIRDAAAYAVEILFYRRIYDLDASLLQGKVKFVHDCLVRCSPGEQEEDEEGGHASSPGIRQGRGLAGLIWPAFIAACEAEDPAMQVTFAAWFRSFARQSGLYAFHHVLRIVEEIWYGKKAQLDGASARASWTETMKRGLQRAAVAVLE
ncbi:fungal-specific transcription factor domain-containing protein [Aspergillus pseudoustus]|uniref:Fungal-specific transcription factor domain-containing protein n=1 Tax=Aspergillus pseudoustus TaxID=1810923 RepID=A0ABR4INL5_9EURO